MIRKRSSDVQAHFGATLDEARDHPIEITRHQRRVGVLLDPAAYDSLVEAQRNLMALRARWAEEEGFIGVDATHELLGLAAPSGGADPDTDDASRTE